MSSKEYLPAQRDPRSVAAPGPSVWKVGELIVQTADRAHPADAVLRQTLKTERGLSARDATAITRAVFAFYRWRGWLAPSLPLAVQLDQGLRFAEQFARVPESFRDADLIAHAVPSWLGREMEISAAWARALQTEPKLWLRAKRGEGRAMADALGHCRVFGPGPLADTLEYLGEEDLFRTPEFHRGQFELQDLSSQAVGLLCAPQPGELWWDACAGEGGKALHLSELMENKGLIWVSDRSAWRLQKLKRRAARARMFNYRHVPWDGGTRLPTRTKFDGVLLDAPCSGTGTWQRNPHARWTTNAQDLHELNILQVKLLAHAAPAVKSGGRLIYAVCALTRAETDEVANAFERQFPEFQPLALANPLAPGTEPAARTWFWPQRFGGNGMFVAAWRRTAP